MPLILHRALPVITHLQEEGSPIRFDPHQHGCIKVGFLNLMPEKEVTERHWFRLLAQTSVDVELHCLKLRGWQSKTTSQTHLSDYYQPWDTHDDLDALIITGAPLGTYAYTEVGYWQELCDIFNSALFREIPVLYLCWAANAALHHYYGIPRVQRKHKISGVYTHRILQQHPLIQGLQDGLKVPHSRHAEAQQHQLFSHPALSVLLDSPEAGAFLVIDAAQKRVFLLGHPEYEADTLHREFERDYEKGLSPREPEFYYIDSGGMFTRPPEPTIPQAAWQTSGCRILENWLANYVCKSD